MNITWEVVDVVESTAPVALSCTTSLACLGRVDDVAFAVAVLWPRAGDSVGVRHKLGG